MDAIVATGVFTGVGAYTCVEQDPDTSYTVDGVTVYPSLADYYPYQLYDNDYPKSKKESYVEVIIYLFLKIPQNRKFYKGIGLLNEVIIYLFLKMSVMTS